MKNINTTIYENNGGCIIAVIKNGTKITNIVAGIEQADTTPAQIIEAMINGFEDADQYDPDNFGGADILEVADELEQSADIIADNTGSDVTMYTDAMGAAGRNLFGIEN